MPIDPLASTGSPNPGTQLERKKDGLGKSDFLKLLTTQLRYQDPINPMEDKDMIAQLAQFSSLEETQAMRTSLDKLSSGDQMAQGASFLGKKVSGKLPAAYDALGKEMPGRDVSGIVSGISFKDGQVLLKVDGVEMPLSYATGLEIGA